MSSAIAVAMTAVIACVLAALSWRYLSAQSSRAVTQLVANARELEKQLHERQREFLRERNQVELAHADALRAARAAAFDEGREIGRAERDADQLRSMSEQRQALLERCEKERELAVAEARNKLRSEYELQSKLFTVKISPYVKISEGKGLLRHSYELSAGYQYQLLVNGIPAFAPHVVADHTEMRSSINPEVEKLILTVANTAAEMAINTYLGGNTQFAKLGEPIFKRLKR